MLRLQARQPVSLSRKDPSRRPSRRIHCVSRSQKEWQSRRSHLKPSVRQFSVYYPSDCRVHIRLEGVQMTRLVPSLNAFRHLKETMTACSWQAGWRSCMPVRAHKRFEPPLTTTCWSGWRRR